MKDNHWIGFLSGGLVMFALLASLPEDWKIEVPDRSVRAAVKAGAAEYYLDSNHERQWRWTPAAPKQP